MAPASIPMPVAAPHPSFLASVQSDLKALAAKVESAIHSPLVQSIEKAVDPALDAALGTVIAKYLPGAAIAAESSLAALFPANAQAAVLELFGTVVAAGVAKILASIPHVDAATPAVLPKTS
jgi:hypothetical protein